MVSLFASRFVIVKISLPKITVVSVRFSVHFHCNVRHSKRRTSSKQNCQSESNPRNVHHFRILFAIFCVFNLLQLLLRPDVIASLPMQIKLL
jgi:hypothetical protein